MFHNLRTHIKQLSEDKSQEKYNHFLNHLVINVLTTQFSLFSSKGYFFFLYYASLLFQLFYNSIPENYFWALTVLKFLKNSDSQ